MNRKSLWKPRNIVGGLPGPLVLRSGILVGLAVGLVAVGMSPAVSADRAPVAADGVPEVTPGDSGAWTAPKRFRESLRTSQLEFALELARLGEARHIADREWTLRTARTALEHYRDLAGSGTPLLSLLDQQDRNLDLAEDLLALHAEDHAGDLRRVAALAQRASRWQAAALGLAWSDPVPLEGYEAPSAALSALAARYEVEPTIEDRTRLRRLDGLTEPLRTALTRFVDAFLALDTAARLAYENADPAVLMKWERTFAARQHTPREEGILDITSVDLVTGGPGGPSLDVPHPGAILQEAGIDLTSVFPTRNQFLQASLDLRAAFSAQPPALAPCEPVSVPPAFSIDLTVCDNTYTDDVALQLDAGGDDRYLNNAGGNNMEDNECSFSTPRYPAAALADLGEGDDRYGDPEVPRCYVNGGASIGAGFLLDGGGNDEYSGGSSSTNGGGGSGGAGFLLDAGGDDTYTGANRTNGGGGLGGSGFLVDGGGNDSYTSVNDGTNGGGGAGGIGFLLDSEGNDAYATRLTGANGGAHSGRGFLLDVEGDDTYEADIVQQDGANYGVNGGLPRGAWRSCSTLGVTTPTRQEDSV